jgi:hypothetical protein
MKAYHRVSFITIPYHIFLKGFTMNKLSRTVKFHLSNVDNRTVRLIITVASLVLFVLAAGAPDGMGGVGM